MYYHYGELFSYYSMKSYNSYHSVTVFIEIFCHMLKSKLNIQYGYSVNMNDSYIFKASSWIKLH